MAEDTFMKNEREYFVTTNSNKYKLDKKELNKAIKDYNIYLQKILLGDSPYVAEDLKITLLRYKGEDSVAKSEN